MTQRALDLLTRWIADNVRAVPEERQTSEAARLAAEFTAYATDAGLNPADLAELEEDIVENLTSHMEEALETVRALEADKPADGTG